MMPSIAYLYSKFFKKIVRGKSILNCDLGTGAHINSGSLVVHSSIGKYSYTGYDCTIINTEIGNYCSLADEVVIGAANHPIEWVSTSPVFQKAQSNPKKRFIEISLPKSRRTEIGSDVWIGRRAIIKGGIRIGHGAVIGAGAIVTKDVEPYAIVAGNPARLIRYRFDESIRRGLLETQWWTLSDEKIQAVADKICRPKEFIEAISKQE